MNIQSLTQVENFFLTEKFTKKMVEWNHSADHSRSKALVASVVGCACVAFVSLADALIHASLTIGKSVAVIATLPFRTCFKISSDFDFVSPFIHLTWTINSLFNIAILPFLCLLNPDKAYLVAQGDHAFLYSFEEDKRAALKQELKNLQDEEKKLIEIERNLEEEIQTLKDKLQKNEKEEIETQARKEEQIRILNEQKLHLSEKLTTIEACIQSNPSEAAQEIKRVEQDETINVLKTQVDNNLANIESLSKQIESSKSQAVILTEAIAELENEIQILTAHILEKQTKLSNCRIENERLKQKITPVIQENPVHLDEIPKPPPAPDFKSPSTGPNLLADPIFDNVRSIFYDLEKEESSDSKEHSNWLETEAGRKDVQEAHAELMSAILRFDKFKESKESTHSKQQPIRLKGKHTSRVDLFFERKNPDGLRRIRRHIQEMMEFFQNALDKNQTKLEVEDLSQSVMFDMGASLIRDTNNVDNMTKAIEDALAYLETYLMYLKPRLEQLANQQKIQIENYEKILEARKQQEAAEAMEKHRQEKEKILKALTLGFVKEFEEDPDITISIAEEASSIINGPKIKHFISGKNDTYRYQGIAKKVNSIEELNEELERVKRLNDVDFEKFRASNDCKYLIDIVEGINKRKYR